MYVILPKRDATSMLVLSIVRRFSQKFGIPYQTAFVNPSDKRTWPNPNRIGNKTWLYMIGNLPSMPVHEANAHKVLKFNSTETESVVAVFWRSSFGFAIPTTDNLFHAHERAWSNSPDATEEDRGLRSILLDMAIKAETNVDLAFRDADTMFTQPCDVQLAAFKHRYDEDLAKLVAVVVGCVQFTLYVTEDVIAKCQLPAAWRGKIVRFVDTTDVTVDTGLLTHHVSQTHPEVDMLVQHRLHQLTNNVCHRYYCRAIKEADLLAWGILAGHPRAASGQVTGVVAPFSDHAWMESIDDMPFLA
jgi:hypothetical protein